MRFQDGDQFYRPTRAEELGKCYGTKAKRKPSEKKEEWGEGEAGTDEERHIGTQLEKVTITFSCIYLRGRAHF